MRSVLVLRSPSHGTGWEETWSFRGTRERSLRDCLARLDEFRVAPPIERWDARRNRVRIEADDRWEAGMLLRPDDPPIDHQGLVPPPAEAAWTASGALRLTELLPETMADLRAAILARFGETE